MEMKRERCVSMRVDGALVVLFFLLSSLLFLYSWWRFGHCFFFLSSFPSCSEKRKVPNGNETRKMCFNESRRRFRDIFIILSFPLSFCVLEKRKNKQTEHMSFLSISQRSNKKNSGRRDRSCAVDRKKIFKWFH